MSELPTRLPGSQGSSVYLKIVTYADCEMPGEREKQESGAPTSTALPTSHGLSYFDLEAALEIMHSKQVYDIRTLLKQQRNLLSSLRRKQMKWIASVNRLSSILSDLND